MLKRKVLKRLLGVSAFAALFGTLAVQAQTSFTQPPAGQSTSGQSSSSAGAAQGGSVSGASKGQSSTQGSTAAGTGGSISKADQKHIVNLAMANMAEIEAARMAQTKSQSEQVKTFAQQMIDDHTKAQGEVQQLAQSKGVTLPTELDKQHKDQAAKMSSLSGEQFDKTYLAQAGIADHKKTHGLLKKAEKAKDADVRALASRLSTTVDQHLRSAQQMHGNKATARGSSGTAAEKAGQ